MRATINRFFVCLLAAVLLCTQLTVGAFAVPSGRVAAGQSAAEELYELGLFRGVGSLPDGSPNFELDRAPTRGEAIVMLVRMLGAEDEALTGHYSHPFTDAGWADAYIGYAYTNRITSGVSDTKCDAEEYATLAQFLTFVLRALGYSDVNWEDPYPTADAVGLYYPSVGEGFYRADVALICLGALDCRIRDQNMTLRTRLTDLGAIDAEQGGQPSEAVIPGPVAPLVTEITVSSQDEFITQLAAATLGHAEQITVYVPDGQAAGYVRILGDALYSLSSPFSEAGGYNVGYSSNTIRFSPKYSDSVRAMAWLEGRVNSLSGQDAEMLNAAQAIHDALVTPGMSEYDQVKAFHDWLVNNTEYDLNFSESSYDAAGPLLYGRAVCDGYSKALDLLCYLSGIDCVRINGEATNSAGQAGSHAWNKVKIDGRWYNVDVTWDDPVSTRPILRYDYFLVSDNVLSRDHDWIAYSFWPEAPANYGR